MTDRELLELAAMAARISDFRVKEGGLGALEVWCGSPIGVGNDGGWVTWNPLTDDGDTLRLAIALLIDIRQDSNLVECYVAKDGREVFATEPALKDRAAATRRAVVRAAAEIGKAQP